MIYFNNWVITNWSYWAAWCL